MVVEEERDRRGCVVHVVDGVPTSRAVAGALDEALEPSGLTADEFGTYSALGSADALTPSDLARWMAAPTTTVSSVVKRFERRGTSPGRATPAMAAPTSSR